MVADSDREPRRAGRPARVRRWTGGSRFRAARPLRSGRTDHRAAVPDPRGTEVGAMEAACAGRRPRPMVRGARRGGARPRVTARARPGEPTLDVVKGA